MSRRYERVSITCTLSRGEIARMVVTSSLNTHHTLTTPVATRSSNRRQDHRGAGQTCPSSSLPPPRRPAPSRSRCLPTPLLPRCGGTTAATRLSLRIFRSGPHRRGRGHDVRTRQRGVHGRPVFNRALSVRRPARRGERRAGWPGWRRPTAPSRPTRSTSSDTAAGIRCHARATTCRMTTCPS